MSTVPALIPLPGPQPASTGSSSGSQSGSSGLFSGTSIDFKTKFAAAIASLSANGSPNTTVTSTTGTATNATGKVDALQALLQKKIATMLQQGTSLSDIVQALAASSRVNSRVSLPAIHRRSERNCKRPSRRHCPHRGQPDRHRSPIVHRPSRNAFGKSPKQQRG